MKGRPALWLVAAVVLVFLAGAVIGVFLDRSVLSRRGDEGRRTPGHFPSLEMMARELSLTADQQARIKNIFEQNEGRFHELRGDIRKHLDDIRRQLKDEIDKILTPEQIQKLQKMINKHRDSARRDSTGHHHDDRDRPPLDQKEGEKQ